MADVTPGARGLTAVRADALTIAPAARRWLDETRAAQVVQVFERAANLLNDAGNILSLVAEELGPGPFALVVALPPALDGSPLRFTGLLSPGDAVATNGPMLSVGALALDTRHAQMWLPGPDWGALRANPQSLTASLPLLNDLLATGASPDSFAPLATGMPSHSPSDAGFQSRVLEAAREPAQRLQQALVASQIDAAREAASKLAGLGGGNTPSGDDFIMGALYALWATRPPGDVAALAEAVAETASSRTVRLSAAYLRAAARGEAGQLWHALVAALAYGDAENVTNATRAILRVGHTSGADALAGFVSILSGE